MKGHSSISVHWKVFASLGFQGAGDENPDRQEHAYSPGVLVQMEFGPQRVEILEHSSISSHISSKLSDSVEPLDSNPELHTHE